jgi:hypothetical protein
VVDRELGWRTLGPARVLLLLAVAAPSVARAEFTLGVLEEQYESTYQGEQRQTSLRLGFSRRATGWEPACASKPSPPWSGACQYTPTKQAWTVLSNGSVVGEVHTEGWLSNARYKDAGLLRVAETDVPRVGNRTDRFAGWPGGEVHRPLVAVAGTARAYRTWTRVEGTARDRERMFPHFRKVVPYLEYCKTKPDGEPTMHRTPVRPTHVEVVGAIQLAEGSRLSGLRIKPALYVDCGDIPESGSVVWFVEQKGHVRTLQPDVKAKNWALTLEPIEVGDFDGDGKTEALFWFSGYNEDGYVLFFEDFRKSARFTWGYH